ncbi:pilus assembly protein [Cellulomonas sp. zg-ZUI188]|uniref:Pilus assembly protein n=1 Tax=Cellulomonas fengjieae TaxID=2819978 RepID=A0ABS3SG95_9CELL|nr:TadE family protein [Cellulomonas fengjieae]MBO3084774.1 pilus assembly protein [Cellulomonas fengjieae]MBO3103740.1 pilus assembly protein [Cellulomonas fengjieae]QVI67808.1 pilus assembly protein [Cellulomonas fengjieae]
MVDFALVGGLVTVLFVAVLQLTLVLHVRNTLVDSAAEGARYGALSGHDPADGAERSRLLITQSLSAAYARGVSAQRTRLDGLDVVRIEVQAPLPLVGLIGPAGTLTVRGHALAEAP